MSTQANRKKRKIRDDHPAESLEVLQPELAHAAKEIKLKINKKFNFTDKQKQLFDIITNDSTRYVLIDGPAGTSKTIMAVYAGLSLLQKKKVETMLYLRTPVESTSYKMGFLPGDIGEKFGPYANPLHEKMEELLSPESLSFIRAKKGLVEEAPINFLRGSNWAGKFVIGDEFQNATLQDFEMVMTRLQEGKVVLIGDSNQSDIGPKSALAQVIRMFDTPEDKAHGIHVFQFTEEDIVRSAVVRHVTKKFNAIREKKWQNYQSQPIHPHSNQTNQ